MYSKNVITNSQFIRLRLVPASVAQRIFARIIDCIIVSFASSTLMGAPPNPNDQNDSPKGDEKEKNPNVINIEGQNNQEQDDNANNAPAPNSENSDCPVPADISKYQKDFSFDNLMSKIKETAKKAGLKAIYMALLLYYALESPTISTMDKAIIYGALGYFICPIDIVPDIIPFIGLTDDIAVLAWAFSRVKHNVNDMTREKAKTKLKIWFGNFDEAEIDDL